MSYRKAMIGEDGDYYINSKTVLDIIRMNLNMAEACTDDFSASYFMNIADVLTVVMEGLVEAEASYRRIHQDLDQS